MSMPVVLEGAPEREKRDPEAERLRQLSAGERVEKLSTAEREVVEAMAGGLSPKEVAVKRGTSLATVRTQIKRAKKKTASRTINELVGLVCTVEAKKRERAAKAKRAAKGKRKGAAKGKGRGAAKAKSKRAGKGNRKPG